MTVGELIAALEDYDENAEVLIMSQQSWPFENSVYGVIAREDIPQNEPDEDEEEEDEEERDEDRDGARSDVFILEGRQLRYGSKAAWDR